MVRRKRKKESKVAGFFRESVTLLAVLFLKKEIIEFKVAMFKMVVMLMMMMMTSASPALPYDRD